MCLDTFYLVLHTSMNVNKQLKKPRFRFTTYKSHRKKPEKLSTGFDYFFVFIPGF